MSVVDIDIRSQRPDQQDEAGIGGLLSGLRLGSPQTGGPLKVLPLFLGGDGGAMGGDALPYITLRRALAEDDFEVAEVSEAGSVTQLLFINRGDACVLGLDGEQVTGLYQDRILATPVLIDRHSTLRVPVSCVERGRWDSRTARAQRVATSRDQDQAAMTSVTGSGTSGPASAHPCHEDDREDARAARRFEDSEFMAERSVRLHVKRSAHASMRAGLGSRADQSGVWSAVEALHAKHKTTSPTRAMREAYAERTEGLDRILAAFPCTEGQVGILVLHGSRVVGLDFVSRVPQYAEVHPRLLRSYALEALVSGGEPGDSALADSFLERLARQQGEPYEAVGLGSDVRFAGDGIVGHVLFYQGEVVHASFFETAIGGHSDASCH